MPLEDKEPLSDNTRMNTDKIINKLSLVLLVFGLNTLTIAAKPAANPMVTTLPAPDLTGQGLYDQKRYSLLYYYGKTVNGALVGTVVGNFKPWPEHIQTLEFAYTLEQDNAVRRFFNPIVGVVQIAGNLGVRQGDNQHTIYEFDPYITFRWANFPWNHYVDTSLAMAEGVSYVSSVPYIERRGNTNVRRLLNYLMFEATFAAPSHPQLQFVVRIHHRSGAYGLYQADNTGSNDIGAGIRYLF